MESGLITFENLKILEPGLGESQKNASELIIEVSSMMSKLFETEVVHGTEKLFRDFNYEVAEISGESRTFLSESTSSAQQKIANCPTKLPNWFASVREASSVKATAWVLSTSAAAAGTA